MSDRPLRTIVTADSPPRAVPAFNYSQQLDRLADLLRVLYVAAYRQATGRSAYGREKMTCWDGGEDRFGKRHFSVWRKLAGAVLRLGADPFLYIQAQFLASPDRPPRPNVLYNKAAEEAYLTYCRDNKVRLRLLVEQQLMSCQGTADLLCDSGWAGDRAIRYALCDRTTTNASDFLRYCLASSLGFVDLATSLFEAALLEYVFQKPDFDSLLGDSIPRALWLAAGELRRLAEET